MYWIYENDSRLEMWCFRRNKEFIVSVPRVHNEVKKQTISTKKGQWVKPPAIICWDPAVESMVALKVAFKPLWRLLMLVRSFKV